MKFKAAALLILFAFTIFSPVTGKNDDQKAKHSCCKISSDQNSDNNQSDEKEQNDCCNNGCNPFVNCCGMMGFLPIDKFQIETPQEFSLKVYVDTYRSIQSNHEHMIWQPPKV